MLLTVWVPRRARLQNLQGSLGPLRFGLEGERFADEAGVCLNPRQLFFGPAPKRFVGLGDYRERLLQVFPGALVVPSFSLGERLVQQLSCLGPLSLGHGGW
jgi:hypothetical protein